MAETNREEERRREDRRKAQERAKASSAINEGSLEEVLKAAGAKRSTPEARRALRSLAERELSRFAAEAVAEARSRAQEEVDEECIACGAAAAERRRASE